GTQLLGGGPAAVDVANDEDDAGHVVQLLGTAHPGEHARQLALAEVRQIEAHEVRGAAPDGGVAIAGDARGEREAVALDDAGVGAEEAEALDADVLEVDGEAERDADVVLGVAVEVDVALPLDVGLDGPARRGHEPETEVGIDVAAPLAEAGAGGDLDDRRL